MAQELTFESVMQLLHEVRNDQTATIYERRNPGLRALGVRFGDLDKLTKRLKGRADLARPLWETGILEPRLLALRLIDPGTLSEEEMDSMVQEIDWPFLADAFAHVVYRTSYARDKMRAWTMSGDDFVRRTGYALVYDVAADPKSTIADAELLAYLETIAETIQQSPNWSREMMNMVPIAIGKRDHALFGPAVDAATRYGKIEVFHGDKTNCKVWDAVEALRNPKVKVKRP